MSTPLRLHATQFSPQFHCTARLSACNAVLNGVFAQWLGRGGNGEWQTVLCGLPRDDAACEVPVVAGIWGRFPAGEAVPGPFHEVARPVPFSIARVLLPQPQ